jgi:hypothetical protein
MWDNKDEEEKITVIQTWIVRCISAASELPAALTTERCDGRRNGPYSIQEQ